MRYAVRPDARQAAVVKLLRDFGCSVTLLHTVGDGCPDLLVGRGGQTFLIEIKSDAAALKRKSPTAQRQEEWRIKWRGGPVSVIVTDEEALAAVGIRTGRSWPTERRSADRGG